MKRLTLVLLTLAPLLLAGCDMLGIESASSIAARKDAEGRAVGGACRHAARSIEQCYSLNKRAEKAAVFAGWREMNDYMRENQIEAIPATAGDPGDSGEVAAVAPEADAHGAADARGKPAAKARGDS